MAYVDGFVIAVPADKKQAYLEMAKAAALIFKEHGALQTVECWGDDVPAGKTTDFRMAVKAQEGEEVVFSWMVWPSKEVRDVGHAAAMADPRMNMEPASMPFDGKRMIFGGFQTILDTAEG